MHIKTGTIDRRGHLCLVLEDRADPADDSIIYRFDGDDWSIFEPGDLVEAVVPVPEGYDRPGDFLAVTDEGVVFDTSAGMPTTEIVGAGYEGAGALKRGLLVFAELVGGVPMAMGFGGQVYELKPEGQFRPFADTFPEPADHPKDDVKFVSGCHSVKQGLHYFTGMVVTASPGSAEIDRANDLGDVDALVAAMLAETRQDYGCVFVYDGSSWRQLDLPTTDLVDGVEADDEGVVYIRLREGVIAALASPDEWEIIFDSEVPISGETVYRGKAVFATDGVLQSIVGGELSAFEPALPEAPGYIVDVVSTGGQFAVIRSESVQLLDGDTWRRNDPPVALGD